MECRVCQNEKDNISFELKEMMYGLRETFQYFQCSACGCIQIATPPPADMNKYYPGDYYSYQSDKLVKRAGWFQRLQCQQIVRGNKSPIGKIINYKYRPPEYYQILKQLQLTDLSSPVLDVGSGGGDLLKSFYKAGDRDLNGIDPFIEKDIVYNDEFSIEKKELFDVSRTYDAIMLNHSLEHMDHQLEVLKKLHSILSKKGRLLIRIPVVSKPLMEEFGSNVVSLDAPRHFYIHSFKSINLILKEAGFITENVIYDAHEFSFWASEQYKRGISLHNHPGSHLAFTDEEMGEYKRRINELNILGQSDNVALYCKKITRE